MADVLKPPADPNNSRSPELTEATDLQTLLNAILGEAGDHAGVVPTPSTSAHDLIAEQSAGARTGGRPSDPTLEVHASEAEAVISSAGDAERLATGGNPDDSAPGDAADTRTVKAPIPFAPRKRKRQERQGRSSAQNGVWKPTGQVEPLSGGGAQTQASVSPRLTVERSSAATARARVAPVETGASERPSLHAPLAFTDAAEVGHRESVPLWRRPSVLVGATGLVVVMAWLALAPANRPSPSQEQGEPAPATSDAAPAATASPAVPPTATPMVAAASPAVAAEPGPPIGRSTRPERNARTDRSARVASTERRPSRAGALRTASRDVPQREASPAAAVGPTTVDTPAFTPQQTTPANVPGDVSQPPAVVDQRAGAPPTTASTQPTAVSRPDAPDVGVAPPAPTVAAPGSSEGAPAAGPTRPVRVIARAQPVTRGSGVGLLTTGVVTVRVSVDASGRVTDVRSVSGPSVLRDIAEDAARRSRFEPAVRSGVATEGDVTLSYTFSRPSNDVRRRAR